MAHVLYRFYSDTGQLLYVGITMDPGQRFRSHKKKKDWWDDVVGITLQHYPNREALASAESRAIEVERPMYNIVRPKINGGRRPTPKPEPTVQKVTQEQHDEVVDAFATYFPPNPDVPRDPDPYWERLIGHKSWRDTRYGVVDDETYAKRDAEELAKWDAIRACNLCDRTGYRGRSLCRHTEIQSGKAREALRRVERERLEIIDGGDFSCRE